MQFPWELHVEKVAVHLNWLFEKRKKKNKTLQHCLENIVDRTTNPFPLVRVVTHGRVIRFSYLVCMFLQYGMKVDSEASKNTENHGSFGVG